MRPIVRRGMQVGEWRDRLGDYVPASCCKIVGPDFALQAGLQRSHPFRRPLDPEDHKAHLIYPASNNRSVLELRIEISVFKFLKMRL